MTKKPGHLGPRGKVAPYSHRESAISDGHGAYTTDMFRIAGKWPLLDNCCLRIDTGDGGPFQ